MLPRSQKPNRKQVLSPFVPCARCAHDLNLPEFTREIKSLDFKSPPNILFLRPHYQLSSRVNKETLFFLLFHPRGGHFRQTFTNANKKYGGERNERRDFLSSGKGVGAKRRKIIRRAAIVSLFCTIIMFSHWAENPDLGKQNQFSPWFFFVFTA